VIRRDGNEVAVVLVVMDMHLDEYRYTVGIRLSGEGEVLGTFTRHTDTKTGGQSNCSNVLPIAPVPSAASGYSSPPGAKHHLGFAGSFWKIVSGENTGEYTSVGMVGQGAQGTVFHVKGKSGDSFALKKVKLPAHRSGPLWRNEFGLHVKRVDREARALMSIAWASPVIVRIKDCWIEADFQHACVIMDWIPNALSDILTERGKLEDLADQLVPIKDVVRWITHIATGVGVLHASGFMHRDIKPANILLSADHRWCKIADLGISRQGLIQKPHRAPSTVLGRARSSVVSGADDVASVVSSHCSGSTVPTMLTCRSPAGTEAYMSPEAIRGDDYTMTTDIYSLGCIFFELLTARMLRPTRKHMPTPDQSKYVLADVGRIHDAKQDSKELFKDLSGLNMEMLSPSRESRPSANQILSRKVLQGAVTDLLFHHEEPQLHGFFEDACPNLFFCTAQRVW
jgi:serine/threonine protein kinase